MNTHPFIKFPVHIEQLRDEFQEETSKIEKRIGIIRDAGMSIQEEQMFLTWGIRGSLAIEGNPISHQEALDIVSGKVVAMPEEYYKRQVGNMMTGLHIAKRFNHFVYIDINLINVMHEVLMTGLGDTVKEYVAIGELRKVNVGVGRYIAPGHNQVPYMMEQFVRWIGEFSWDPREEIIKAIVAHVMFACIHPYGDGNGRMARLIENMIMIRSNIPEACALMLTAHYWDSQQQYYHMLDGTHGVKIDGKYLGEIHLRDFVRYALEGFYDYLMVQWETLDKKATNLLIER